MLTQNINEASALAGNSCELTAAASSHNSVYYQWQYSDDSGINWSNLADETDSMLTSISVADDNI